MHKARKFSEKEEEKWMIKVALQLLSSALTCTLPMWYASVADKICFLCAHQTYSLQAHPPPTPIFYWSPCMVTASCSSSLSANGGKVQPIFCFAKQTVLQWREAPPPSSAVMRGPPPPQAKWHFHVRTVILWQWAVQQQIYKTQQVVQLIINSVDKMEKMYSFRWFNWK